LTTDRGNDLVKPSVLVTGGAGYVGSHACKALHHAGYLPVTFDSLERGHRWAVRWGPLEVGWLQDRRRLEEVLLKYKPVAALHFAAYAYVGESMVDPGRYYWNNVAGSLSLLEALRHAGVAKIVFSSTCSTFGIPDIVPITEDCPQRPINAYGASKLMVERALADYDQVYGLRSVSLRYFNAAGADPETEIGEVHDPETHLIPLALEAAMERRPSVTVFGSDYPTADGTCIRDYIHVADLAEAHVLALKYLDGGGSTCGLNLGTGKGWSVTEVINAAMAVSGKPITVVSGQRRAGDPPALVADAARAMRVLGWTPKYPHVQQQIDHAWRWLLRRSADHPG
jgi:UDP-arabinose 4-epimerase